MAKGDYDVGYGKPPKATQFQKGKSGHPSGRAPGSRGLKSDLAAELEAKETIKIGGKLVKDTRQRQALRTMCIRAANGDLKAQQQLFPLIVQVLGIEDRNEKKERLSASDHALLQDLLGSYGTGDVATDGGATSPQSDIDGSDD